MVKPELDVTLDYYALLNVSLRADPEEIKKSYRKLGTPHLAANFSNLLRSIVIPSRSEHWTRADNGRKVPITSNST